MEQNKFYTPKIEDLFVGYECERWVVGEYGDDWIPHTTNAEDIADIVCYKHTGENLIYSEGFPIEWLRTKYLDKKGIESLGWVYLPSDYKLEIVQGYEKGNYWLFSLRNAKLIITIKDQSIEEWTHNWGNSQLFFGECKSINELRKLMEWLSIK